MHILSLGELQYFTSHLMVICSYYIALACWKSYDKFSIIMLALRFASLFYSCSYEFLLISFAIRFILSIVAWLEYCWVREFCCFGLPCKNLFWHKTRLRGFKYPRRVLIHHTQLVLSFLGDSRYIWLLDKHSTQVQKKKKTMQNKKYPIKTEWLLKKYLLHPNLPRHLVLLWDQV